MKSSLAALFAFVAMLALLSGCASRPPKKSGAEATMAGQSTPGTGSNPDSSSLPSSPNDSGPGATPASGSPTATTPAGKGSAGKAAAASAAGKAATSVAATPAPPRTEPLIMENADRMEGYRSRGEYILSGKVRFSHGGLRLETEKAVWLKDQSLIYAEAGMKISHHGAVLTSDRGSYDKNRGQATAEGKVRMRDSSGEVEALGNHVTYLRFKHLATLSGEPEVRRYYRKSADSGGQGGPSAAKAAGNAGDTASAIDTLVIRGRTLTYDDSAQVATADSDVRITRKKVLITCKKAEYHDRADSLYLVGEPVVKFDESQVKGVVMRVGMNGEEIRSLLVKGDAQARTMEAATDTSSARQSDVKGDSLFLAFKGKAIDSVQVFRNTKGSYFDVDKPDFVNRMSGEYMVLRFNDKKISSANVMGGAKSTYFHLEKKAFKGKNDAEGDTIDFAFKDGKVDEVMVRGRAKGTYFGEPQSKKPAAAPAGAPAASPDTSRPGPRTAPAPAPAVSTPLPAPAAAQKPATPKPTEPKPSPAPVEPERPNMPNNPWRKK